MTDIGIELAGHVAIVEIRRPPHNFFDHELISGIAAAFEHLDKVPECRAIVLASQGKSFCAGATFNMLSRPADPERQASAGDDSISPLYEQAVRLFQTSKPIVGAIHGAAIGGGLGLALVPDFRVTCPEAVFSANFTRLGFHPGFGLTAMLPDLVGTNQAALLLYSSRRVNGEEATRIGLAEMCVAQSDVRSAALSLANEIAQCGPLAVMATRQPLAGRRAELFRAATQKELKEQMRLRKTEDYREGIAAARERREPIFHGR